MDQTRIKHTTSIQGIAKQIPSFEEKRNMLFDEKICCLLQSFDNL